MLVPAPSVLKRASWLGLTDHSREIAPIKPASAPVPKGSTHRSAISNPLGVLMKCQSSSKESAILAPNSRSSGGKPGAANAIVDAATMAGAMLMQAENILLERC